MAEAGKTTIAIGCQGGGMHAAFEVGVLTEILQASARPDCKFKLVGLSGTSAGALCALMAWYGLAKKKGGSGSVDEAVCALNRFWDQFVAGPCAENILNLLTVGAFKIAETEIPLLRVGAGAISLNPVGAVYRAVAACLPSLGVRREYFDLEYVLNQACPHFNDIVWDDLDTRLLIGASEAVHGYETVFDSDLNKTGAGKPVKINRWRQRLKLSLEGVAASGTLPSVREAQRVEGRGCYWDGLYSQNPPVRDFVEDRGKAPDEIWILRINPQEWPKPPETLGDIRDRENELMGNLSLHKDLDFIQKVNFLSKNIQLIKDNHELIRKLLDEKGERLIQNIDAALHELWPLIEKEVVVRTIKMQKQTCDELQFSSKFNRSRDFLDKLRAEGEEVAAEWLSNWPPKNPDDPANCYPDDAGYGRR